MAKTTQFCFFTDLSQSENENIFELYSSCFDASLEEAWSEQGLKDILSLDGVDALFLKALEVPKENKLAGFIVWRTVAGEAELLNVGVLPEHRNNGFGGKLLDGMAGQLKKEGVVKIFLEVRKSNLAAKALYKAKGFEVSGVRSGYYDHADSGREDAIIMRKA